MIVEFSQFNLEEDADEQEFLAAAEKMQNEFLKQQPGFVKRELLKTEGDWFEIVHWNSTEEAEAAADKFEGNLSCEEFAEFLDGESVVMLYLDQVKTF